MTATVIQSDCLDAMRAMPDASFTGIVTDPPYGIGAGDEAWDRSVPGAIYWSEALRILKPGGRLLAFGGTRTFHRLACAIEDSGFVLRDTLAWLYGTGMPKSLDISQSIDRMLGVERRVVAQRRGMGSPRQIGIGGTSGNPAGKEFGKREWPVTAPGSPEALMWDGYGTSRKPCYEPIIEAERPPIGGYARNALAHGVAGLNIRASRAGELWTPNLAADAEAAGVMAMRSRVFFESKVRTAADRHANGTLNFHPTLKPVGLMRWLVRGCITPIGTRILDPFAGSGTTGVACVLEGVDCVLIEREPRWAAVARDRIAHAEREAAGFIAFGVNAAPRRGVSA